MSLDRERLAELVERVRRATGADREIDRELYLAFECKPLPPEGMTFDWIEEGWPGRGHVKPHGLVTHYRDNSPTDGMLSPHYTASIDATLGLVERLLPGWRYAVVKQENSASPATPDGFHCWLEDPEGATDHQDGPRIRAPLAILTALLTALLSLSELSK